MANPPPPYDNITGISRAVMKDNAQETLANYDGNARPGELVVDQTTSIVYVGNALGDLTAVATPGGATTWALLNDKTGAAGPTIIALGQNAGLDGQAAAAIALGQNAGQGGQGTAAITIGQNAGGNTTQGSGAVAIGISTAYDAQGQYGVAIGPFTAMTSQGTRSVAIGLSSGQTTQGANSVAIGQYAGNEIQGVNAVAIGNNAGYTGQGISSVAIGEGAGQTSQANNSIILNATGSALDQTTANTFTVAPVRNDVANTAEVMFYNTSSKEITYGNVISVTGNISGNYFIGNGSQLTNISTSFAGEMHVSKDGNDSTGAGTILRPYLTIGHALTQVGGGRNTIVIHPGGYTENPTITSLATQLITYDATGASTLVNGTVTIANTTGRIAGLKMTNLAITGNAQAYINSSTVDGQFTKSSSGYVEVDDCELQVTGNALISGSGITTIIGNKINNLVVNNAGASVLVKGANDCVMPQVTAGSLNIVDSIIRASSNTANAVTASAGTVVTLMNNQIVTPAADNVARVSIAGFHSIIGLVYDKANSTLSNSLNSVVYFQTANVDSLVSSGNVTGNYFVGNGSQLTGIVTNTGNVTFSGEAVIGTGTSNTVSGLYLAPDPVSLTNDLYLRVRGNILDEPTHIHFDTGNNAYYNQFIGDDNKYIQLANTGNIVINTSDYAGNTAQWTFNTDGNLTFPTGNLVITPDDPAGNIASITSTDHPLGILSTGANGAVSSLWVEDIGNVGTSNIAAVYANPTPGSGIVRIAVGQNGSPGPNLWDFDTTGNLTAPGNISATGNITGAYLFGNGSQLTGITASVPSQTILPTIQTITVVARPAGLFGGGQGGANVTVANTIPVTEYGVIITSGTSSQKYATGALGSIPGTVSLTFTTGLNHTPFTVYAYVTSNAGTYYSDSATGTSGICLLAGTQIALSDGTRKAIEHITYTDKMLSWDFDRGCYAETTALWIKRGETGSQYNLLTFSDGTTLRTFDQHRIFNKQAGAFTYPMTDETPIGTITVNEHGQEITLIDKQVIVDSIEYYNVITDYHMNLFSDSILTSCRFNNIYPIQDMKFVKDSRPLRSRSEFHQIDDRFFHGLRLAEQQFDLAMIEWYVARLESLEIDTDVAVAV